MSKKLLSGPYLMWMIGFTIIPLALIVFYGLTDRSGAFTLANILSIATAEHRKALWLSLGLSLVSTIICFILAYPLALILRSRGIGQGSFIVFIFILPMWMKIFGAKFVCVDKGFGNNKPVDVVIRPEDIDLVAPGQGSISGVVTHLIFKGVHYEMEVTTPDGFEWLVHSTDMFPVGQEVDIHVDPFDIQIMNKPASEDEEAVGVNE